MPRRCKVPASFIDRAMARFQADRNPRAIGEYHYRRELEIPTSGHLGPKPLTLLKVPSTSEDYSE
jgi:hypothetical protein